MTARPAPTHLRVEHHRDPIGVGEPRPRLSWTGSPEAAAQVAYEVHVRDAMSGQERTSGRIASSESVLVPWPFEGLPSRARREVRVRTWSVAGADGERAGDASPSPWSASVTLETGLLERADWLADLISPDWDDAPDVDHAPALLRRDFRLAGEVAAARLYATAHGLYEVEINGVRVGDDVLAPGWTSYRHRLRYRTHDVTALVRDGANAVGATLADGWFRGRFGFEGGVRNIYGERTALLAQLEVTYADGRVAMIGTDGSWRAATGPITVTGIYDGETYDARLDRPGWSAPGYDDGAWAGVRIEPAPSAALVAPTGPPVRRIEEVAPVEVITSPSGATILDFGQNLVGRLRIQVRGEAGTAVTLRHAEVLENGELGTRPLRQAAATDTYVMRGDPAGEEWEPRFTFHGFRYAEVDGWRGDLDPGDVRAVVVHTDMRRTGTFTTGDPLLDRLHENVVWGMRGNFIDIPTDCPQRDERLGWTGDIQVFAPTASYLYDCAGLLTSWLRGPRRSSRWTSGPSPSMSRTFRTGFPLAPLAAWGDAAVVVPWVLYQRIGDAGVLARQCASMTAWVDQVADLAGPDHLWDTGLQLGDWLDPAAPPDNPADARTDRHLVATAYHAWTAGLLAEAAEVLGRADDAARYAALAAEPCGRRSGAIRRPERAARERRADGVRAGDLRSTSCRRRRSVARAAGGSRTSWWPAITASRPGSSAPRSICDALSAGGDARHGVPPRCCRRSARPGSTR